MENPEQLVQAWRAAVSPADKALLHARIKAVITQAEASIFKTRLEARYFEDSDLKTLADGSVEHCAEYYFMPLLSYLHTHPQRKLDRRQLCLEVLQDTAANLNAADLLRTKQGLPRWQQTLLQSINLLCRKKLLQTTQDGIILSAYGLQFLLYARSQYAQKTQHGGAVQTNIAQLLLKFKDISGGPAALTVRRFN